MTDLELYKRLNCIAKGKQTDKKKNKEAKIFMFVLLLIFQFLNLICTVFSLF